MNGPAASDDRPAPGDAGAAPGAPSSVGEEAGAAVGDAAVGPAGPPAGTSPASWLLMRFSTQMHAVSTRFAGRHQLHPTDVTAMAVLAAAGGRLHAGELSTQLELSTGATTRLIDRLERLGHVARTTDPIDRRRRQVSITPSAGATAGAYFGQLGARVEEVLDTFDAGERAVITAFLDALVDAMEHPPTLAADEEGGEDTRTGTSRGRPRGGAAVGADRR